MHKTVEECSEVYKEELTEYLKWVLVVKKDMEKSNETEQPNWVNGHITRKRSDLEIMENILGLTQEEVTNFEKEIKEKLGF